MSAEIHPLDCAIEAGYDQMAEALETRGYSVIPGALPPLLSEALLLRVVAMNDQDFKQAGVGRAEDFQTNHFVRSDEIRWFNGEDPLEKAYLDWMSELRVAMNRRLFLGLFDYECHFSRYAPGAFYKKHVDAFKGKSNRVLSTVVYLNPGWSVADGGQLLIYDRLQGEEQVIEKVLPLMGTMVIFLSDRVPHEVAVAKRQRHSIAGWFRVNESDGAQVDPPLFTV